MTMTESGRDGAVFPQHEVVATARTAEGNVGTRSIRQ